MSTMMSDTRFDLSGDFNDALSIIAASDSNFANEDGNASVKPNSPISPQCFVEEEQQIRGAAQQHLLHPYQQSQSILCASQLQRRILTGSQGQCQQPPNVPFQMNQQPQSADHASYLQAQVGNQRPPQIQSQQQPLVQSQPTLQAQMQNKQPCLSNQLIDDQQTLLPNKPLHLENQHAANHALNRQRVLALYQQTYNSSSQDQQQQQQTPCNFAQHQPAPACPPLNAYAMPPQQKNPLSSYAQQVVAQRQPEAQAVPSKPYVEIVEQPAPRGSRFRYGCEARSLGSIPGVSSTHANKTYPTIRIVGYNGEAVVVVSCVTKDEPYLAHPHNLVGKVSCKGGICKATTSKDNMTVVLDKLGIQCIKRKDVLASLNQREKNKVDPFKNGFEHKYDPSNIDLSCVRLAVQVYLEGPAKGQFKLPLPPVVFDPIYDKKSNPGLQIYKLSHCTAPANGGSEIIILCDKVVKEDIRVRFYQEQDEEVTWEAYGTFSQPNPVHKNVAISVYTPKYKESDFNGMITVHLELVRPSDGVCSNTVEFYFVAANEHFSMQKKRKRLHESLSMKNLEAVFNSDRWNIMNQPNFNIIEAR